MQAFHGKQSVKDTYLNRVEKHQKADQIVKGVYWEKGRGCAVGCTVHSGNHAAYEKELGIPEVLARLEDRIFENLPLAKAKLWPGQFLTAVKPGADLSLVWHHFAIWLLSDREHGTLKHCTPAGKVATKAVVKLFKRVVDGGKVSPEEWEESRFDAYAAAAAAADADADAAAAAAARITHFELMADKLLKLLAAAPVKRKKATKK